MQVRLYVRKMMLEFFHEVLGVPDPATGLAGAGRLVVVELAVQRLDEFDALSQGFSQCRVRFVVPVIEVPEALVPSAVAGPVADVTTLARRFIKAFVGIVAFIDELLDEKYGIRQGFY